MLFTGQHDRSLDEKWRLVLPSSFRRPFEAVGGRLSITRQCLLLFTEDEFEGVMDRMIQATRSPEATDQLLQDVRVFAANTLHVLPDAQGRFVVAERHRQEAGITRDVTVIGSGPRLEIWDAARYRGIETATGVADSADRVLAGRFI